MTDEKDTKLLLAKWLSEGIEKAQARLHLDRTRLEVRGQKEWYKSALCLDDPYFNKKVEEDQQMMMAYKGRRSDDVVEALRSAKDSDRINTGVQPVEQHLREKYRSSDDR